VVDKAIIAGDCKEDPALRKSENGIAPNIA
jgi:hypothetical protein